MQEKNWEKFKDLHRRRRVPFLIIKGGNQRRAIQLARIQELYGGYQG